MSYSRRLQTPWQDYEVFMPIKAFPPVEHADEDGLLAVGGDLSVPSLLLAYSKGVFPWPISEDFPLAWFAPPLRGVLVWESLTLSRSDKKLVKKCPFEIWANRDFEEIILHCSELTNRTDSSTWITSEMINAYTALFHTGHAFCVGAYDQKGQLQGGVYGLGIERFLAGESMFYRSSGASKLCLLALMSYARSRNVHWLDTQMKGRLMEKWGGQEWPREKFQEELTRSIGVKNSYELDPFFPRGPLQLNSYLSSVLGIS